MSSHVRGNAERLVIFAGIALSIALALGFRESSTAHAETTRAPEVRIATVDVLEVAQHLVAGGKYAVAREAYEQGLAKPLQDMAAELKALQERYNTLAPDAPERKDIENQFSSKSQALQQAQQKAVGDDEVYKTSQVAEAYRLVLEAADQLGADLGYTHVIATRSGPVVIKSTNVPGAVQEMLARPLVRGPAADDITERLFAKMKIEKQPEPAKAEPVTSPPAPASPAAPK